MKKMLGIDISKESFDSGFLNEANQMQGEKWTYSKKGIKKFLDQLPSDVCLVMEATGVYHKRLAYAAVDRGITVCVENPARINYYAKMQNYTTKTDKNDAQLIARYALDNERHLQYFRIPPASADELDQLQMYEAGLKKELQRCQSRMESVTMHPRQSEVVKKMLKEDIKRLKQRIKETQKEMRQITKNDFKGAYKILNSVPGIGDKIAIGMICAMNGFSGWDQANLTKRFIKYLGLAPVIHQSGRSVRKKSHISRSGVPNLRAKLYMGATAVVYTSKNNNIMKQYYVKKMKEGKSHKEAIVAVMHKMVRVAIALVRDNCHFDEKKYGVAK